MNSILSCPFVCACGDHMGTCEEHEHDISVFLMPEQLKLLATNWPEHSKGQLVSQ